MAICYGYVELDNKKLLHSFTLTHKVYPIFPGNLFIVSTMKCRLCMVEMSGADLSSGIPNAIELSHIALVPNFRKVHY